MKKYKIKAKIEAGEGGGAYVLFPYDSGKEFATKGKVPVKATFDGVPYTGSLFKYGNPLHLLVCPKPYANKLGKARAMLSSSTAICAILIYARRNENKFCIMHDNLLLDS